MPKMRVNQLAKELEIDNKQIIEFLNANGHAVASHSSNVEESAQELVRQKFGKGSAAQQETAAAQQEAAAAQQEAVALKQEPAGDAASKGEAKPQAEKMPQEKKSQQTEKNPSAEKTSAADQPKKQAAKPAEADRPKKKSSITAVFNAQYSKQGAMYGNGRRPAGGERRPQGSGERRPQGGERRPQGGKVKPAASGYDVRKAFERAINPEAAKAAEEAERLAAEQALAERKKKEEAKGAEAKPVQKDAAADKPVNAQTSVARPQNNIYGNVYAQSVDAHAQGSGERRPQSNGERRPQGSGERRPQGSGERRPQGSGERRAQGSGERQNSSRLGRDFGGNKGGRPDNGQRPFGGRPSQNSNQGDRNGARGNSYRGNGQNSGRPGQDRFNKESAGAAAEEIRGKESREREKDRNKNNRQRSDYDALGSRKQERFTNLEKGGNKKKPQQPQQKQEENVIRTLVLPDKLTIKELADKMKVQASVIVKKLFLKGTMVTVNQEVDFDTAEEIALEFNCICEQEEKVDVIAELLKEEDDPEETLTARPPVVCVMGHVDHGKTSLLDAIRSTRVTDKEAGGITQHIGASVVSINDQKITFLDTPGHEAFTAMRMRGANSTDIAILVVAADDGVMPQTIEAINHAKAAGVEIIVAINKIDKPSANIERVKQELSEYELIPEDWGGSTVFCPVSAHTKEGIENLLEMILLTAEVLELKANPKRNARGLVIEAQLDKGRGAVATVLVQKGTLKVGQPVACGSCYGKVRAMIDDQGRRVKEAGPSTPVEILGLSSVPEAGETFVSTDTEKEARAFAETYISESKNRLIEDTKAKMSLDDLFSQIQSGNVKELDIIVKADVQGSVEAVRQSLVKLSNDEVVVKVIHGGVGAINESDVSLASASNAIIIGFNVRPDPTAKITADKENVDVRLYKVIYNAIEDVEAAMKGMLDPIFEEKVLGHAEVRQIFKASGVGNIAGSYVLDGVFQRGCKIRISREGTQIFEGNLASLKRFKDDVKEVKTGYECGLVFEGFNDIAELDIVEAYTMVEVPR